MLAAPRGRFTFRAVPEVGNGAAWALLVRWQPAPGAASAANHSPLTRRGREILDWVAAGKTDRQIGAIIGASERTVQKHLEHIYVKLGVENRTAAAMRLRSGAAENSAQR
jgi:DNA-binding CsgD family transcriptional regulator